MNVATKRKRFRTLSIEQVEGRRLMAADIVQPAVAISAIEQLDIELINRGRANPLQEAARYGVGLNDGLPVGTITTTYKQPLAPVAALQKASELHSKDMIARDYFDHTAKAPAPDGVSPTDRARKAGYTASAGENLAYVSVSGRDSSTLVSESHRMLVESASHRQNFLLDRYTDIGVGTEYGDFSLGITFPAMLTTEMFGKSPTGQGAITGVVYSDTVTKNSFYSIGEGVNAAEVRAIAADGTVYRTTTAVSGGYAIRVPDGKYDVYARLSATNQRFMGTVTVKTANIKLDLDTSKTPLTPPAPPTPPPPPLPPPSPALDTNKDGSVSSLDVLAVMNFMNASARGNGPDYSANMDVNGDRSVSSLDILQVYNYLNLKARSTSLTTSESIVDSAVSGLEFEFSGLSNNPADDDDQQD